MNIQEEIDLEFAERERVERMNKDSHMNISKFLFVRLYNLFIVSNKSDNLYYNLDRLVPGSEVNKEYDRLNNRATALKGLIRTDVDEIVKHMLETYPGKIWSFDQLVKIVMQTQSKQKMIQCNLRWIQQTLKPFIDGSKGLMRVCYTSYYINVDGYMEYKEPEVLKLD